MQASESAFESSDNSKRLLYFANLIYSRVFGHEALKKSFCVFSYSFSVKSCGSVEIGRKKTGVIARKWF